MKKIIAFIVLILGLSVAAASCKESTTGDFYNETTSYVQPTTAQKADLMGYAYDQMLNRGLVRVSETTDDVTLYGVIDTNNAALVFTPQYSDVTMYGDFLLLSPPEGEATYTVAYLDGTVLKTLTQRPTVEDIGGGLVSLSDADYAYVFKKNGAELLTSHIFTSTYSFTCCGDYILAYDERSGAYFIFNALTGVLSHRLFPSTNETLSVHYAGGNDFIAVRGAMVTETDNYTVAVVQAEQTLYMKQTVSRVTVGNKQEHIIPFDGFLCVLENKYSFGTTEEERETYPLQDGYFTTGVYVAENKVSRGDIQYAIADKNLTALTNMPQGIRPDRSAVDGYVLSGNQTTAIYVFDEKLAPLLTLSDRVYESVRYSDGAITAAYIDSETKRVLYGAFDLEGNLLIEFKYSYISEFLSGKAVAVREGKAYVIDKAGNETYVGENALPYYWYGFYEMTENTRIGIASFDGTTLIPASYRDLAGVTRQGEKVYVALRIGNVVDLYILK